MVLEYSQRKEQKMKISEMTNEELADYIVNVIGGGIFKEYYAEAAARLRKFDITIVAQKAKAAAEGYAHGCEEVADLRRRLKVAEDALEKITTGSFSHKDGDKPIVQVIIDIASNALFAIREEGCAS